MLKTSSICIRLESKILRSKKREGENISIYSCHKCKIYIPRALCPGSELSGSSTDAIVSSLGPFDTEGCIESFMPLFELVESVSDCESGEKISPFSTPTSDIASKELGLGTSSTSTLSHEFGVASSPRVQFWGSVDDASVVMELLELFVK